MYQLPELASHRPGLCEDIGRPRIFFAIYYRENDHAFRKAARTWQQVVKHEESYQASSDFFFERQVDHESGFKAAWSDVKRSAEDRGGVVWIGHLFTHSSLSDDGDDGLEFRPASGNSDSTLSRRDIGNLPTLPWHERSYLVLAGCNSGVNGGRGWNPAQEFATKQGVMTVGQNGYGYFSKRWSSYEEKSASDSRVCLWAYLRRRNSWFGSGGRVPGLVFRP